MQISAHVVETMLMIKDDCCKCNLLLQTDGLVVDDAHVSSQTSAQKQTCSVRTRLRYFAWIGSVYFANNASSTDKSELLSFYVFN